MRRSSQHPLYHEVAGLLLVGGSILLFLALISYDPGDLPRGLFQASEVVANAEVQNFVGRLGAVAAGLFFFLYGVPAFLIATLLFGLGLMKLLAPERPALQPGLWMAVLVVCASCISQIQPVFFQEWSESLNLRSGGAGGALGYWLGGRLMMPLFGRVGSLILLSFLYFASLILMTGIHPAVVIRRLRALGPLWLERYRQYRAQKAAERALESAAFDNEEEEERPLPRPARNGSRRSRAAAGGKTGEEEPAAAPSESEPEFDPDRPAPQVIDTTAPAPRKPVPPPPRREKPAAVDPFQTADAGADMELYDLPGLDLLEEPGEGDRAGGNPNEMLDLQATLIDTLSQFGIPVAPGDITRGPTITRYEVYPAKGIRVDKIVSLERDLARATCAERINILAPIPGKDTVGIEIANAKKQKVMLRELLESADWEQTSAKIPLVLGKDVYGKTILGDLAAMPHLLVAGTTGSGKSVCVNSIIASIIYRFKPDELRFIMIDPKVVEMQVYNRLPHLAIPVVTDPKKVLLALRWVIDEMEKRYKIFAKAGVRNITTFNARPKPKTQRELDEEAEREADRASVADRKAPARAARTVAPVNAPRGNDKIIDFNPALRPPWESGPDDDAGANGSVIPLPAPPEAKAPSSGEEEIAPEATGPTVDEAAALPADEPEAAPEPDEPPEPVRPPVRVRRDDEIEIPVGPMPYIVVIIDELADLMQTAPADVESAIARITQMARAAGIHMIVATQTPRADVITGVIKANIPTRIAFQVASALDSRIILDEKGAERLLGQGDMMYVPPGTSRMTRAQGVFVTDEEIRRLVDFSAAQGTPTFNPEIEERLSGSAAGAEEVSDEDEELVNKCIEIMIQERKASTSLFQRRLRLGYTRAARVVDILEQRGYVAAGEGAKPREILIDLDTLE
ncbi:MAG TPA: DNA translocase FtsK [Chthoniobacteraceae bacterium]|nr:DNA translocase FtsK [Chthoniobacteraceae bacterium]